MHNVVDLVGVDAVKKVMDASKFCRFKIFKETDGKGSLPTFESVDSKQHGKAIQAFDNWANTALSNNPYNSQVYSMYLYSKPNDSDVDATEEDDGMTKQKKDKIRFSFSLTGYNPHTGQQGMAGVQQPVNVSEAVEQAVNAERERVSNEAIREELKQLREDMKQQHEEAHSQPEPEAETVGEDEEEEEQVSFSLKDITDSIKDVKDIFSSLDKRKAAMAGDEDDDDDAEVSEEAIQAVAQSDAAEDIPYAEVEEEEEEEEEREEEEEEEEDDDFYDDEGEEEEEEEEDDDDDTEGYSEEEQQGIDAKRKRLADSLKILVREHKNIDKDLELLARMAQEKPQMFKQGIGFLRDMYQN